MGNDTTSYETDPNNMQNLQRFSSTSTHDSYNTYHHSKRSTMIKPPNNPCIPQMEYSHSGSNSKSKSKSKSKKNRRQSKSKSKSVVTPTLSHHLSLPDVGPELPHSNSFSHSNSYTIGSPTSKHNITHYQHQQIDLTKIQNGITNRYVNARVVKIAAEFWEEHVANKSLGEKLEVGCAIYFGMMVSDPEMKRILSKNLQSRQSIENSSVKFLDMMGWLLRSLLRTDIDLTKSLQQLGAFHRNMGINISHFDPMLNSMHDTFSYYFPIKYGIQIKYAIDQIFTLAAQIMTGQDLNEGTFHLADLEDEMKDHSFLQSLRTCLSSNIGREYLYRYLQQTFCDEIAIFLQSLAKFRIQLSDKERFMVARDIVKNSIEPAATFAVNISYETRSSTLADMVELERVFFEKSDELKVSKDMFDIVEKEILKLIMDNHWRKFNQQFKSMDTQK